MNYNSFDNKAVCLMIEIREVAINCNRALTVLAVLLISGCSTVSFDQSKPTSIAVTDTAGTAIGKRVAEWDVVHGGNSGFYPLSAGMDALGARLKLLEGAEKSVDIQTFLMKPDSAGIAVITALIKAADRGVRIRFLLDDIFTSAPDKYLHAMNEHPNIQIRLFNPISRRGLHLLNFAGDFRQANRRMHNKAFTVDNSVSIVGGRNIADEYFQLKDSSNFLDYDVVTIGPVVKDISLSFDEYWNHSRAVPIDYIVKDKRRWSLDKYRQETGNESVQLYRAIYKQAFESTLLQDLFSGKKKLYPATARLMTDSPDKLITKISRKKMRLANDLAQVIVNTESTLHIITPYLVPGDDFVNELDEMSQRGVDIKIITNSLASINHIPVHSAYSRYRKALLDAGVELYELRANADDNENITLTLHTKIIIVDRRYMFVGSLNLDPRSIEINAEMGILIDSPELAENFLNKESLLPEIAYRVKLNKRNNLEWHGTVDGEPATHTAEPLSSIWRRFKCWIMHIAPESQL